MFTTADLDSMYRNDEWEGFGYLGERRNRLNSTDPEAPADPALVAEADAIALEDANNNSLTPDEFFAWANSRCGRYFGDVIFGGGNRKHLADLLPSKFVGLS